MIADQLANAHRYRDLGPRIARAFEFIARTDLESLADGRYELDGSNVFALVQRYTSKPEADGIWEAHRLHADLQFVVAGEERIGYGPQGRFTGFGLRRREGLRETRRPRRLPPARCRQLRPALARRGPHAAGGGSRPGARDEDRG